MAFKRALLLLGAAFVLGNASGASAADLGNYGGGSIKDGPYVESYTPSAAWYFRVDGAYSAYDIDDVSLFDHNIGTPPAGAPTAFSNFGGGVDDGWSIGGGIGKRFGNWRIDATLEHRGSTDLTGSASASCCDLLETETSFDGIVGLANLYYDFNRGGRIIPYIGAGIGFAHLKTDGGALSCSVPAAPATHCHIPTTAFGDSEYGSSSTTNFAVAAMAGLSFKLFGGEGGQYSASIKDAPIVSDRALYLDAGYRFLYLGDFDTNASYQSNGNQIDLEWNDLTAHEVRVGLRYELN